MLYYHAHVEISILFMTTYGYIILKE